MIHPKVLWPYSNRNFSFGLYSIGQTAPAPLILVFASSLIWFGLCVRKVMPGPGLKVRGGLLDRWTTSWPRGPGLDSDESVMTTSSFLSRQKVYLKLLLWVSRWHFRISENGKTDFPNSNFSNFYLILETFWRNRPKNPIRVTQNVV